MEAFLEGRRGKGKLFWGVGFRLQSRPKRSDAMQGPKELDALVDKHKFLIPLCVHFSTRDALIDSSWTMMLDDDLAFILFYSQLTVDYRGKS
jgi:hypothetical protein